MITEEYSQFARNVDTFEWGNVLPSNMLHGTPEGLSFVLHDTWEAEWLQCSSEINASAVEQRLWTLMACGDTGAQAVFTGPCRLLAWTISPAICSFQSTLCI